MLLLLWKPLVRAHSLAKNTCLLSISLSVLADVCSCGLQLLLFLLFQYVQAGNIVCTHSAPCLVPPQVPSPGRKGCCSAGAPISASQWAFKFFLAILILFLKEQRCEPWHTWANSSWKILLKWTSFGSNYRKRYSSLSVLLKVGVILLLSSRLWLNFSGGMETRWKWFNDRFTRKCPQIINRRISLGKKSY